MKLLRSPIAYLLLLGIALARPAHSQNQVRTPVTGAGDDEVVASVAGRVIRMRDLERRWQEQDPSSFARVLQEVYEGKRHALDSLIDESLLENEAKKRGMTIDRLLEAELPRWMPPPTDWESGAGAHGASLDNLRSGIGGSLQKQVRPEEALPRFIEELRKSATDLTVHFDAPRQSIHVFPSDRVFGPASARVEIVEFGDFQCPSCKQAFPTLKKLISKYRDQIRFVWKDFPLPGHPDARPAAEAAQCVNDQGKFWGYHDKLFGNQNALGKSKLKEYAKQVGIDVSTFSACFDKGKYRDQVQASIEEGNRYGVSGTPTVFINGRIVVGVEPYEVFEQIVREELVAKSITGGPQ